MTSTNTSFLKGQAHLTKRHRAETRFQMMGRFAIALSLAFLIFMVGSIFWQGKSALQTHQIALKLDLSAKNVDPADIRSARFDAIIKAALRETFPDATKRAEKRKLYGLVSTDAGFELRNQIEEDPSILGGTQIIWVSASDDVDIFSKGQIDRHVPESDRRLDDQQIGWIDNLAENGAIKSVFNTKFFTNGDSREPELAGILSALVGSALSLSVCFLLSFPIGILSAVYLEEFAPKNRWSDIIEININNLAAVPSIVFGLLGLSIFLSTFGLPRSSPLVGGMVLSLMTLPTIIIASRASLRAVPPSIREAALGMGASPVQATFHHVAPLALPGMFTGAIVGMARALGDTAPLLMIGMVAFIVDVPKSFLEPATALPVQIFLWADAPERAFLEKTSAAIIVLLLFLVLMNIAAIILRKKYELRF
ncbi:phosphate transport system permease protein PstA [Amylibacter marinus]|uniref:Phosphate transport system permease protein PstA n=1 Tax=Amylibacter marinus TaxID=1475483 RepID=A0ABQ5VQN4_9RHOB|nr:phosphate ABC transporter permease PstA [Amylibacter marinus]GLQ33721.1 phosphate transport system permease protein PstA [Amylibacter marinus]